jgi:hypothetical protein
VAPGARGWRGDVVLWQQELESSPKSAGGGKDDVDAAF